MQVNVKRRPNKINNYIILDNDIKRRYITIPKSMTDKQSLFIKYAITIAHKSTMTQKHAAILINRNKIIGEGFNKSFSYLVNSFSIHAEIICIKDALKRNKNKLILSNLELYVIRISYINNICYLRHSKPCENCSNAIINFSKKYNIKTIYYTIDDNSINVKYKNK
jgi:deoxycytidylate deaminase